MPPFRRILRWALIVAVLGTIAVVLIGGIVYSRISADLPDVQTLRTIELQEPMYVYAKDGRLMEIFGEYRRIPVKIEQVPKRLQQAFLAIEDARFYEHQGVDFKGVARAIWLLATTDNKRVPGGSTITQQVARQYFLSNEVSYTRKLKEMLLAMRMEDALTKDEILALYLNKSFFGHRAYGVGAAADFYYGKTLDQLSLDEMASLASIPKFPSSGNPISNPDRARERRNYTLQRMAELGYVSQADAASAQAAAMHASPHERAIEVYAPYITEMVRLEMVERYGEKALTSGFHVTTTLDPELQAAADAAVRTGLAKYDHRHGWNTVEKHFELKPGESAGEAALRLRGIPAQAGLLPAIVMDVGNGGAQVVLANATTITLDAASSRWTGRSPAALVKRGDLVRVKKVAAGDDKDGAPDAISWRLDQLPRAQSALVSLEAETGALRAIVGGLDFAGSKYNRATQARRQPGSSFKPFLYAASFERGFNPASIVLDAPVVFRQGRGKLWRPQNDGGGFAGPMRLREALVQSRNLVSVRLLDAIGVDYARRYIAHFGIDEAMLPPNLSMSLGTATLPPIMVARGYAAFTNGGFRIDPWFIDEVRDREGKVVFKANPPTACRSCAPFSGNAATTTASATPQSNVVDGFDLGPAQTATTPPAAAKPDKTATTAKTTKAAPSTPPREGMVIAPRAIDPRVAYQLVSMMRDVVKRGTATDARVLNREDVGGKTGSTNDHMDAWFAGFGGPYVTVVWVGRDDNKSLGYREYGGKAALPIWIEYMRTALKDKPVAANDPPEGMVQVSVSASGRLIPGGGGITEYVKIEDMERMQADIDYGPVENNAPAPTEEAYDIF